MLDSIKDSFTESIQIQIAAAEALLMPLLMQLKRWCRACLMAIKFYVVVMAAVLQTLNNLFLVF